MTYNDQYNRYVGIVEETMEKISGHYGVKTGEFFVLSNGIFTTAGYEGDESYARVKHIPVRGAQLDKVVAVNQLSRENVKGQYPDITRVEEEIPDQDTPVFVYCQSGGRSRRAAAFMEKIGYSNVKNIGGVAGYNACAEFTGENPTIDTICDHIFHFMELDPSGKHIALGGDLDGITAMPSGFEGVQSWPVVAERLIQRGLDEKTVMDIFWNNAIGVMDRAVCNHKRQ